MTGRRKAIPESRDWLQSRLLVGIVAPVLAVPCLICMVLAVHPYNAGRYCLRALIVSLTFGLIVWAVRAATLGGVLCGSMICLLICADTIHGDQPIWRSGLAPLTALFLLTFIATRAGKRRKIRLGVAQDRRGRNAAQVIANLGMAALVLLMGFFGALDWISHGFSFAGARRYHAYPGPFTIAPMLMLAALCEATADTVSSEIGQAFGGQPVMLTTFRRVDPGTDGAVTLLGTAAGIAAAAFVALTGMWAMRMSPGLALVALLGGVAGLLFDSLLGATVERKGWLGNDLVNFSSTAFAALTALALLIALQLLSHE